MKLAKNWKQGQKKILRNKQNSYPTHKLNHNQKKNKKENHTKNPGQEQQNEKGNINKSTQHSKNITKK